MQPRNTTRSKIKTKKPRRSGLALHGSIVALAPARAVTSHARRIYEKQYRKKYRRAPWIFALDFFLAGLLVLLVCINACLWFLLQPPSTFGLKATMYAPVITGSKSLPIELVVKSADGRAHQDIRLRWNFPPSVETEELFPKPDASGVVNLGDIAPFKDVRARALVRVRAPIQTEVPFYFRLTEGWYDRPLFGHAVRRVESGALSAMAIPVDAVIPGASIPILIKNEGDSLIKSLMLRLTKKDGAPSAQIGNDSAIALPQFYPGETRTVFIDLGDDISDKLDLSWQLEDGARIVALSSARFERVQAEPRIQLLSSKGDSMIVRSDEIDSTEIFTDHLQALSMGTSTIELPSLKYSQSFVPIFMREGKRILGARTAIPNQEDLKFQAEARIYTKSGEQIGVGPHPPQVGETTSYWIVWHLPAQSRSLRSLRLKTDLGDRVIATGKCSTPINANVIARQKRIIWNIPEIASGSAVDVSCEIELKPQAIDAGKPLSLFGQTTLTAIDAETGNDKKGNAPGGTTELSTSREDVLGDGVVRP